MIGVINPRLYALYTYFTLLLNFSVRIMHDFGTAIGLPVACPVE